MRRASLTKRPPPVTGDLGGERAPIPFFKALADLNRLVLSSGAPQLRLRLAVAVILTIGGKLTGVIAPLLLGRAVNSLSRHAGPTVQIGLMFVALALGWALIRFLSAAAPQARDIVFGKVAMAAQRRAGAQAFGHALRLPLDFHQAKRTGSLSRTIDRGARAVDFLLRVLVFNLAPTALELVFAAGVLAKAYDWRFAATAIITVTIYGVLTFAISDWRIAHRRRLNDADSEASGRAVDALLNYETVKVFGAEVRAAADYDQALAIYGEASEQANASLAFLNIVQAAIMSAGLGVMALLAGYEASQGRMGPGDLTASILIMISLYQPLNILGFAYREIRQALIDMEALLEVTEQRPDIEDAPDAVHLPSPVGASTGEAGQGARLTFSGVAFRHGARLEGLSDICFEAEPGQTVAVVGPSGGGKTTLVRLALRLIDPQAGAVLLDGIDLRQLKLTDLRQTVSLVPQDVALFNGALGANIGFARPDASEDEIWAAAEAAELGAFIRSLPEGMATRVGERGLKLSGGERQRVGLARALLANPRLLILDEATSALDSRTEAAIAKTLRKARAGRTLLVVAHRLSTIADADQILVLRQGRLIERGDHASLLRQGGEYAALWRKQTRGAKTSTV